MSKTDKIFIDTDDGIKLYCEISGIGYPLLFVHEFGGDCRSWEPQVNYFSKHFCCIAFNARGYPPSDVPKDVKYYSQNRAWMDIRDVLLACNFSKAHIVGLSMGGAATLHLGLNCRQMVTALIIVATGTGSDADYRETYRIQHEEGAKHISEKGIKSFAEAYCDGPLRVTFRRKNLEEWTRFREMLAEHSPIGTINTALGVLRERPSLYDFEKSIRKLDVPSLIIFGDSDIPCSRPCHFLAKTLPNAGLAVLPDTGHTLNLEEPVLFNGILNRFITRVDNGTWK